VFAFIDRHHPRMAQVPLPTLRRFPERILRMEREADE